MNTSGEPWNPTGSGVDAVKEKQKSFKERAWYRRQSDTSWGRAFAHLVPLYPFYYAFRRNTITPILYLIMFGAVMGFFVAHLGPADKKKSDNFEFLIGIVATPVLAKMGIDRARKYGKLRLIELDSRAPGQ